MRAFEIALSAANVLALLGLALARPRRLQWKGAAALATAVLAGLQAILEGPRWQMAPAYVASAVFLGTWLAGIAIPGGVRAGMLARALGVSLGALVLAASVALPVALPVFHIPGPTGPYAIGSLVFHWTDTTRPEIFTADPGDHRELMAQVWYPAQSEPGAPRVPYLADAGTTTSAMARIVHLPGFFFAHFRYVTSNAVNHAPVADRAGAFPVIVFLSGLGGFRSSNTYQVENLVSHGYVVVGLDQPGGSAAVRFPDGRLIFVPPREQIQPLIDQSTSPVQDAPALNGTVFKDGIIPYFAQDVSLAIDELTALNGKDPDNLLTGRLDLQRIGVLGISLGAIVGAEASHRDLRIKASVMMDAAMPADVVKAGLSQPCMWISRPAGDMRLERSRSGGWPEAAITETLTSMRKVFDEHAPQSSYYLDLPGTFHVNFTDAPFWSPLTSTLGLTGPVDGRRTWDIVNACTVAFFDKYLNGSPEPLLDDPLAPQAYGPAWAASVSLVHRGHSR